MKRCIRHSGIIILNTRCSDVSDLVLSVKPRRDAAMLKVQCGNMKFFFMPRFFADRVFCLVYSLKKWRAATWYTANMAAVTIADRMMSRLQQLFQKNQINIGFVFSQRWLTSAVYEPLELPVSISRDKPKSATLQTSFSSTRMFRAAKSWNITPSQHC